eukprot:c7791_g1_i1.p1 GENE.c7791_g1_i1~~c7791_g1_i1.p1  ORF type:complete len:262 (+),score=72.55 c7791_g1_i1:47-787(+)
MSGPVAKKAKQVEEPVPEVDNAQLEKLNNIQQSIQDLNQKCVDEIVEIEKRYNGLKRPHFDERKQAISGIPDFWKTVFLNHPLMSSTLGGQHDEEALSFLENIDVTDEPEGKSGFAVTLTFRTNPFFENTEITKSVTSDGEDAVVNTSPVKWKKGKDLTETPAESGKSGKRNEPEAGPSFFSLFLDAEESNLAEIIREEIWPNPVRIFLGEVSDDEFVQGDDGDFVDGDDDDGDDGADDDADGADD